MAKNYPVGFRILIPEPVEVKMVSWTIKDRNAIKPLERFRGLFTYVVEDDTFYYLGDGILNTDWKPIGKPQAIIIHDEFHEGPQQIISGQGFKSYLLANYYTKEEVDARLAGLEVPLWFENISQEKIEKWDSIQSDISKRVDFPDPKITWVVPHPENKSVTCYLPSGMEIHGRKININPTLTSINWSQPKVGYALIN